MQVIQAPNPVDWHTDDTIIFLAGSIEMGKAENWQGKVIRELSGIPNLIVLNPRRNDWDSSWEQSIKHPHFRKQVEWELDGLTGSNIILMYFSPGTKSPITLLEFGLYAKSMGLRVCCPKGFWRKGNVDIVCERFNAKQFATLDTMIRSVRRELLG